MGTTLTHKLIEDHLVTGEPSPGADIRVRFDQTLSQDATGTLVMLHFEALGTPRVRTEVSAQYVDHNVLQTDFRSSDDHAFLRSAARKFGVHYSRPGNGISHVVHMERFGRPGATVIGADSHTPAAGSLGMFAIGAGGLEVALAMAGKPIALRMPTVFGVRLTGALPDWVSAKDLILELIRRHGVAGAVGSTLEYYGPGVAQLSAMDRHVVANMGTEMGATSTVFPSDPVTDRFLRQQGREASYRELSADDDATFDFHDEVDLGSLVPLIALPSSPGNVVPVEEVGGQPLQQAYIGSSANPGLRDFAIPAMMVDGRQVDPRVSFDVNPTSRQVLLNLARHGYLGMLVRAGARLHQTGCNGCIGMGQAPATGSNSLRTVPRNFPGRSGTREDAVFLCSPETATASALRGVITDPRALDIPFPKLDRSAAMEIDASGVEAPVPRAEANAITIVKGPNIASLPEFSALPDELLVEVAIVVGDDVSTDEIIPAGAEVLPYRSNIPRISRFVFRDVDAAFATRTQELRGKGISPLIVAGANYGQGSSREHAAIAPRYLGVSVVIAASFSRIHEQNLANFGILPLRADREAIERLPLGSQFRLEGLRKAISSGRSVRAKPVNETAGALTLRHDLSEQQIQSVLDGSLIASTKRHDWEG